MIDQLPARMRLGAVLVAGLILGTWMHAYSQDQGRAKSGDKSSTSDDDKSAAARNQMVERHLIDRGIKDKKVLDVFRTVPRHLFLPPGTHRLAYDDESIPIGEAQTITAPFDVAFMTEVLKPKPTDRVFEVGTGSGYQSAILSRLVKEVYSVEIHASLGSTRRPGAQGAGLYEYPYAHRRRLRGLARRGPVRCNHRDLRPEKIPQPLVDQLKDGGRMAIPLGKRFDQTVYLVEKHGKELTKRALRPTLFVPMTGRAQREAAEARAKSKKAEKGTPKNP